MSEVLALVLLYAVMPEPWQFVARIVLGIGLAIASVFVARKFIRDSRAFAAMERAAGHGWREGQSAAEFQAGLIRLCGGRGWQVFWSVVLDSQRVVIGVSKRGRHIVLLCLAPGATVTARDVSRIEAWRVENTAERALVLAAAGGAVPGVLGYEALSGRGIL